MWFFYVFLHGVNYDEPWGVFRCQMLCQDVARVVSILGLVQLHQIWRIYTRKSLTKTDFLLGLLWEWWEYLGDGNTRLPNMWELFMEWTKKTDPCLLGSKMTTYKALVIVPICSRFIFQDRIVLPKTGIANGRQGVRWGFIMISGTSEKDVYIYL